MTPAAIDKAIYYSGGVVRDFVRLVHSACTDALVREEENIDEKNIDNAIHERRNDYTRLLSKEDLELLQTIKSKRPSAGKDERMLRLLHNRAILEYVNDERWCDVNPLLEDLVEENTS